MHSWNLFKLYNTSYSKKSKKIFHLCREYFHVTPEKKFSYTSYTKFCYKINAHNSSKLIFHPRTHAPRNARLINHAKITIFSRPLSKHNSFSNRDCSIDRPSAPRASRRASDGSDDELSPSTRDAYTRNVRICSHFSFGSALSSRGYARGPVVFWSSGNLVEICTL